MEEYWKACRIFGNYLEEDKRICGKCPIELKNTCMAYTYERRR